MTRALIVARADRPFNSTMAPFLTGRVQRTAHPRRLTSITWHDSENGSSGSKLMSVIGSSQGTRVPPRVRAVLRDELTGRSSKAHHCRILVWLTCGCFPRSQFVTAARKWHSTRPASLCRGSPVTSTRSISSEGRRLFPCWSNSRITNSTSIRLQWSTTSLPRAIRRKVLYYDTGHDLNDPKALEDRYDWLVKFINLRREPSSSPVRSPSRGANRRACSWVPDRQMSIQVWRGMSGERLYRAAQIPLGKGVVQ